ARLVAVSVAAGLQLGLLPGRPDVAGHPDGTGDRRGGVQEFLARLYAAAFAHRQGRARAARRPASSRWRLVTVVPAGDRRHRLLVPDAGDSLGQRCGDCTACTDADTGTTAARWRTAGARAAGAGAATGTT